MSDPVRPIRHALRLAAATLPGFALLACAGNGPPPLAADAVRGPGTVAGGGERPGLRPRPHRQVVGTYKPVGGGTAVAHVTPAGGLQLGDDELVVMRLWPGREGQLLTAAPDGVRLSLGR
ncbi:MAG: hypothetical protein K2X49_25185 [Acetobacteraceae bacterium]|nr:hypothetical protein [Acetobacteraceae bacterium]